ncbi:MAG: type 4a pilus biogenesis protein PilO [Nitrospinales bacterium]
METPKIDFKKLAPREIAILMLTVATGLGFAYYTFEYQPQAKRMKTIDTKLKKVESTIRSFKSAIPSPAQVKRTERQMEQVDREITKLEVEIKAIKDNMRGREVDVLDELRREAELNGVTLESVTTEEKTVTRGKVTYKEVSLVLKIQVHYSSIGNFIAALEKMPAIISLKSMKTFRKEDILPRVEALINVELSVL